MAEPEAPGRGRTPTLAAAGAMGALAVGYSALKAVAWLDRRRYGVRGDVVAAAQLDLAEPRGTRHRQLRARDGASLHVLERGPANAAPIVLLHGVTLAARFWHHQLDDLADEFRVIAPDLRAHGRSTVGSEGYGLRVLADDLLEVLEQCDVHDAVIVGHSMGGMTLLRCWADHPGIIRDRLRAQVLLSTAASHVATGPATAPLKLGRMFADRQPELAGRVAVSAPGDLGYTAVRLGFGKDPNPLWVEQVRDLLNDMAPMALTQSVLALLDHDVRSTLPKIDRPTVVMVGSHDLVTPPRQSREMADAIPGARLEIVEDAGHTIALERRAFLSAFLRDLAHSSRGPSFQGLAQP